METIKNWAFSICCAAICGGIFNIIIPEGGAQKTFKTVLCVFFLCVLVVPLSKIEIPNLDSLAENIENSQSEEFKENDFVKNSSDFIENRIISETEAFLLELGIYPEDISIKVNISENGGIDINKFILTLDCSENIGETKEKVRQKIGIEPEIIISGEQ